MSGLKLKVNSKLLCICCVISIITVAIIVTMSLNKRVSMGTGSNNYAQPIANNKTNIDIDIKERVIVLEVGQQYILEYADVTYSTNNARIAYIDTTGVLEGISSGTTSITIKKSGKICGSIIVIVNEEAPTAPNNEDYFSSVELESIEDMTVESDSLTKILQETVKNQIIVGKNQKKLTSESLYQLQKKKINLTINCDDYKLCIDGKDIDDHSKTFDTKVNFNRCKSGYTVKLNTNKKLPGKVYLIFKNNAYKTKYIYGFNNKLERYELISDNYQNKVLLSKGEKYLLTNKKLYKYKINSKYFIALGIGIAFLLGIYIVIKKRYWFW